jgi:hypothetical protein
MDFSAGVPSDPETMNVIAVTAFADKCGAVAAYIKFLEDMPHLRTTIQSMMERRNM